MALFFSSDHHFGHANIIKHCHRPFESVEQMNETLIRNWNEVVKPDDSVFYLGDFSLDFKYVREFLPQLNGHIVMFPGNHDAFHPMHKKAQKHQTILKELGVTFIDPVKDIDQVIYYAAGNVWFKINHFPCAIEGADQRYLEWRPKPCSFNWLLHGHSHSSPDKRLNTERKMLDIGVDGSNYKPISIDAVMDLIDANS